MSEVQQPVVMTLPKELVEAHIKQLVVDACAKNGADLIRGVVNHVMTAEDRSNYGQRNIDKLITALVLEVANASVKEWLAQEGPKIRDAVRKRLTADKTKLVQALCDKITDGLLSNVRVSLSLEDRSR